MSDEKEPERGSGITSDRILRLVKSGLAGQFEFTASQLTKAKQRQSDLNTGFAEGMNAIVLYLVEMGVIQVISSKWESQVVNEEEIEKEKGG